MDKKKIYKIVTGKSLSLLRQSLSLRNLNKLFREVHRILIRLTTRRKDLEGIKVLNKQKIQAELWWNCLEIDQKIKHHHKTKAKELHSKIARKTPNH